MAAPPFFMSSNAGWWISGLFVLTLAVVLPLLAFTSERRSLRRASLLLSAFALGECALLSIGIIARNDRISFAVAEWAPQMGLTFLIDRLSAFFLLTVALIALSVVIYSLNYVEHEHSAIKKNLHVALMNLFILSMLLVVAAANTLTFLFFWEVMSVSSFFLVMYYHTQEETKKAGQFYFAMTQLSTVFLIFAFVAMYAATGSLDIAALGKIHGAALSAILLASFFGFAIKAGIIPFHKWLPYAHPASPSNISALMSGVMLKVAVYGLLRVTFAAAERPEWWGALLLSAGTISAILGGMYALKEVDIKRMLAYHSIENIGILFVGLGLSVIFERHHLAALARLSLAATWFHAINHALFKSLLFMTAGSVAHATGTRNMERMGGLIKLMPRTAAIFLIGSIAIAALPPFNGFVSELMIFQSFLSAGELANPFMHVFLLSCLGIFALTSALASACFVRAFGMAFLALPRSDEAAHAHEVERWMVVGPALNALFCMILGIFSSQLFAWFGSPMPIPNMLFVSVVLVIMLIGGGVALRHYAPQPSRVSETWGCGLIQQTSRMEYTATSFSEPILKTFETIYGTRYETQKTYFDRFCAMFKTGSANIHTSKFHEDYLYQPIANVFVSMSERLARMQSSVEPDVYILVLFLTSLALIILGGMVIL